MSENALAIDFGAITGGSEPAKGSADATIAQASNQLLAQVTSSAPGGGEVEALPGQEVGEFSCMKMLTPAQQEQARAAAVQLYPKMLANTQMLAEFGSQALDGVNAQVDRIFKEVGPVQIPELTNIMKQVNDTMRTFRKNYDPNIPKVRDAFERVRTGLKGLFQRGRDIVEMLFEEARSVERQLDVIAGKLTDKQRELRRNVVLCDELYAANEQSISQLIGVIAIMEAIRDVSIDANKQIVIDSTDPNKREKEELKNRIAEFTQAMLVRINEFQQRLFVAWSTSPQVRNTRSLHYGLGQRLALMVNLTIPTMKLTIAQWGLLMQGKQAAQMQQVVADGANDILSAYAQASGQAVGEISHTIQTPTLRPETILEIADSLDKQATSMIEAAEYGMHARQEVTDALLTAQSSISKTSKNLSESLVKLATASKKEITLPQVPALPGVVAEQAGQFQQPAAGNLA